MYSNPPAPAQGHAPAQRSSQQWDPRDQPPPSQYPPPPHSQPYPPQNAQGGPPRPDMAAIHPQQYQQPDYRLPPPLNHQYYPPDPYNRPPMQNGVPDPYRQPMPNGGQDQYRPPVQQPAQSAPRQRTAIACKYCRRRKIRCSGFENSEDGRCSNCVRFSQECVFTPVSSQAQAFVPAQALWGRQNGRGPPPNQPLYGAFGQPIPQSMYPPPPPPQGYTQLPSPTTPYPPPPQQHMYQNQPYPPPPQQGGPDPSRRRGRDDPHSATLPPPNPAAASHMAGHREGEGQGYTYPDPTPHHQGAVSPATSSHSYSSHPQQPYYAAEPPRRTSPQSAGYAYDNRASSSPHAPAGYPPASGPPAAAYQPAPSRSDGRTPPPVSTAAAAGGRPGMSIHDIVSENGSNSQSPGERSTADNDMVSALNRRPPNGGAPRRS